MPDLDQTICKYYEKYLFFLKELVKLRSPFTEIENVKKAINYCKEIFEQNLENYEIYFDKKNNLIALPRGIDIKKEIIYLSAHIDTVSAVEKEWDSPYKPFEPYEDENEIVARGVNDCKAGVAYQLYLSYLSKEKLINLKNIIFTISFKEEGAGVKTAVEIGKNIGKKLPLSEKSTYLIVLENNVRVKDIPVLCIYFSERSNYAIQLKDYLPQLQENLKKLKNFNPTCIRPEKELISSSWNLVKQTGGHVCSIPKDKNLLHEIILKAKENSLIKSGEEKNFATIYDEIFLNQSKKPQKHIVILNNRSFDSLDKVMHQLKNIQYKALKDFSISSGFNIEDKIQENRIFEIFKRYEDRSRLEIEFTFNVGGSDGTIIYSSMGKNCRENFYPIIMGPGSRSQKNIVPARVTHGKNETFDKKSSKEAVIYISQILNGIGTL